MFARFSMIAIGVLAFNLSALGIVPAGPSVCQNADVQCPGAHGSNVCIFNATSTAYVVLSGEAYKFSAAVVPTPAGILGAGVNYQGTGFYLHIGTDDAPVPGGTPSDLTVQSLDLNADQIMCSIGPVQTKNCTALKARFNAEANASRSCQTAADCSYAAGAGGYSILVGDDANIRKLDQILNQYFEEQCMPEINGPMCMAIEATQCESGKCQGGGCGIIVDLQ